MQALGIQHEHEQRPSTARKRRHVRLRQHHCNGNNFDVETAPVPLGEEWILVVQPAIFPEKPSEVVTLRKLHCSRAAKGQSQNWFPILGVWHEKKCLFFINNFRQ